MAGSVCAREVAAEIREFGSRYGLNTYGLMAVLELPEGTLNTILYNSRRGRVEKPTVDKIRRNMKVYDPRTCRHRQLTGSELAEVFDRIRQKHGLTWTRLAEIMGKNRDWMNVVRFSKSRKVPAEEVREMMWRYHEWLRWRERQLAG